MNSIIFIISTSFDEMRNFAKRNYSSENIYSVLESGEITVIDHECEVRLEIVAVLGIDQFTLISEEDVDQNKGKTAVLIESSSMRCLKSFVDNFKPLRESKYLDSKSEDQEFYTLTNFNGFESMPLDFFG